MLALIALLAYLVGGLATMWLGYWWFVAFVFLSPLLATILAARAYEYWPVVHPAYSFFFVFPAGLIGYQLFCAHPLEWGQWLLCSLGLAVALVGILTIYLRKHIDREWAVIGTLVVVLLFAGFALDVVNTNWGRQRSQAYFASIAYTSPGGYRQGGPRITVDLENGDRRIFFVGWNGYFRWQDGRAVCVCEYEGALGWRWSMLSDCPDGVP